VRFSGEGKVQFWPYAHEKATRHKDAKNTRRLKEIFILYNKKWQKIVYKCKKKSALKLLKNCKKGNKKIKS
jgi:hypothetical protein